MYILNFFIDLRLEVNATWLEEGFVCILWHLLNLHYFNLPHVF